MRWPRSRIGSQKYHKASHVRSNPRHEMISQDMSGFREEVQSELMERLEALRIGVVGGG